MSQVSDQGVEKQLRKLPDLAICQAHKIGFGGLVKCLVDDPVECAFALDYGTGHFCVNPDIRKLLEDI